MKKIFLALLALLLIAGCSPQNEEISTEKTVIPESSTIKEDIEMKDYQCFNCGGHLQYDSEKMKFTCDFCRSEFTEDELKQKTAE